MMELTIMATSSESKMVNVYIPRLEAAGYKIDDKEPYHTHKITFYGLDALLDIRDIVENDVIITKYEDQYELEIYDDWRE